MLLRNFTRRNFCNSIHEIYGGKAKGLKELVSKGYLVPKYLFINAKLYDIEYKNRLDVILLNLVEKEFPDATRKNIYFAVRSSASKEDGEEKSFAGQFYTGLGITTKNLVEEVTKVRDSFKNQDGTIIIQEFIPSDRAGVIFTDAGKKVIVINSNFGLCDSVVKGDNCDSYFIDYHHSTSSYTIIKKVINRNKNPLIFKDGQIALSHQVSDDSLDENQINKLIETAKKIEKDFNKPQDIEFCFRESNLYILQSRPITRKIIHSKEYYDGANIQENYNGIVLPLTFSFVSRGYSISYQDMFQRLGVSKKIIDQYKDNFDRMLCHVYGRIFNNMNNWYIPQEFLPWTNVHRQNFKDMISTDSPELKATKDKNNEISKFTFVVNLLKCYIQLFPESKKFTEKANEILHEYSTCKLDVNSFSYEECVKQLHRLEDNFLKNWWIVGFNNSVTSFFFGRLKRKHGIEKLKDVIKIESVNSTQVHRIQEISKWIFQTSDKGNLDISFLKFKDRTLFRNEMKKNAELEKLINNYLKDFGGRFANELKLETKDIFEDFESFCTLINLYSNTTKTFENNHQTNIKNINNPPHLSIVDRIFLFFFKLHAGKREKLRLLRTNFFGISRSIFNRIGSLLENNKILDNKDDIFYLTLEEIMNMNNIVDVKKLIFERKDEFNYYKSVDTPSKFVSLNGEIPNFQENNKLLSLSTKKSHKGIGCCPGLFKGIIRVFNEFELTEDNNYDIIVAKNTDPGWATLIGTKKALIVENGGILSHAAIISRELGIPTVIGIENITKILRSGQLVEVNGGSGEIKIID